MIQIRALSKKQAGMYGTACCAAIEKALALAHGDLPAYPRTRLPRKTPRVLERIRRLKQMRERLSDTVGMEPGLLINNNMISALAFADPKTVEALSQIEGMRNWQVEALGEDILRVLAPCR
jgi:ribonuclease D